MKTLGADYTEEAVTDRIAGRPRPSRQPKQDDKRINFLIDIQNNIKAQESAGFAHWAKINNLKQAAKTMNFLTEHGISSYEELEERTTAAADKTDKLLASIKTTENRMADLTLLTNSLVSAAADFDTAQKIRAYIATVEKSTPITPDEIEWIAWAKKKADWYDPTIKNEDEILGNRKPNQELKEEAPKKPWEW